MRSDVRIGTCGFGRLRQSDYVQTFSTVEIQHTFYQPPMISTLEKWRAEARAEFEFTLKAWQLITHDSYIRTYKRLKRTLTDQEKREAGSFRDTLIVQEAWETTRACAQALAAKLVLFQCPPSFRPEPENVSRLRLRRVLEDSAG